ncbi:MAG: DUF1015 domain-containing protein [Chloroflexi bacterium]|nr:DUF1015 domain-containing protein [Chloroflexota bacterium]
MTVVKPFRGVRYNPARVEQMQQVVSQPYDRIDSALQQQYYDLSPYNIVRVIQDRSEPGDQPEGSNVYTRARDHYRQWLQEGVLMREEQPAFYAYEQRFTIGGQSYTRLGLIAAVQLVEFDQGVILPHERTHSGPKEDRLRLLRTLEANTEQIFLLYPDPENRVNALIRQAINGRESDIDVVEIWESDVRQRVWVIRDPATLQAIEAEMAPKRHLIIADGHHRYETGLNYRNEQRASHPDAPDNAAFNFVAATLVSMDDPGLVILPTHREIANFGKNSPSTILERAKDYFAVQAAPDLAACLRTLNESDASQAFGFYGGQDVGFHVLTLRDDDLIDRLITGDQSHEWKTLGVSVLHRILLDQIAEVPAHGIEDKTMIRYHRDPQAAVQSVDHGSGNFVFFVRPTRMANVKAIAQHGEKMPQKSTDFYPKVISGLTLLPLGPEERL